MRVRVRVRVRVREAASGVGQQQVWRVVCVSGARSEDVAAPLQRGCVWYGMIHPRPDSPSPSATAGSAASPPCVRPSVSLPSMMPPTEVSE